ncbi:hypothetical protein ACVBEQ_06490 [Nakamurella sp. GG22]
MTEHQNDTVKPETDPPANHAGAGDPNTADQNESDTFTLAGPQSDPAGPAVRSVESDPPPSLPADPPGVAPDYDKYGVPSLDFVRNKIEGRYATSAGAAELAQQTWEATSAQERAAEREKSAQEALERIRQSLRDNKQS